MEQYQSGPTAVGRDKEGQALKVFTSGQSSGDGELLHKQGRQGCQNIEKVHGLRWLLIAGARFKK